MLADVPLVGVAGGEADLGGAHRLRGGHGQQADRAGADDQHPGVGADATDPHPVPGHRGGLDQCATGHVEADGEVDQPLGRGPELLGHAAVGHHAEGPLGGLRAEVDPAVEAVLAGATAVEPLDRHGRAVGADTGQLVAEDVLGADPEVEEVGGADADRSHG